jgi:hypothetical protein
MALSADFKNGIVCFLATSEAGAKGQDPFQIRGCLCQTRKTPTLYTWSLVHIIKIRDSVSILN